MNKKKIFSLNNTRFRNAKYHAVIQKTNLLTDYNNNFNASNHKRYFPKNRTLYPINQNKLFNYLDNSLENKKSKEKNIIKKSSKKTAEFFDLNLENNLDSSMDTIKNILFDTDKKISQMDNNKKITQTKLNKTNNNLKTNISPSSIELTKTEKNNLYPDFIPNYYDLGSKYLIKNYITNNNTNVNYHKLLPKKISMNRLYNKSILVSKNIFYNFRIVVFYLTKIILINIKMLLHEKIMILNVIKMLPKIKYHI